MLIAVAATAAIYSWDRNRWQMALELLADIRVRQRPAKVMYATWQVLAAQHCGVVP